MKHLFGSMDWRRLALSALPSLVFLTVSIWAQATQNWGRLIDTARTDFAFLDLAQVTATATCISASPNWSMESETCDPLGRGYNYPSIWARGFSWINIGFEDTVTVGYVLFIATALAFFMTGWWTFGKTKSLIPSLVVTIAAISPAVFLLAERGNIDSIVFLLVVLSAGLAARGSGYTSGAFISLAAVLKVFPFAGYGLLLTLKGSSRTRALIVAAVISLAGGVALAVESSYITSRTPQGFGTAFGAAALPSLFTVPWGTEYTGVTWRLLGLVIFAFFAYLAFVLTRNKSSFYGRQLEETLDGLRGNLWASALLLGSGGSLVGAYLMGVSSDYRMVFTIPVIAALLSVNKSRLNILSAVLVVGLIATMWLSFGSSYAFFVKGVVGLVIYPFVALLIAKVLTHNFSGHSKGL